MQYFWDNGYTFTAHSDRETTEKNQAEQQFDFCAGRKVTLYKSLNQDTFVYFDSFIWPVNALHYLQLHTYVLARLM